MSWLRRLCNSALLFSASSLILFCSLALHALAIFIATLRATVSNSTMPSRMMNMMRLTRGVGSLASLTRLVR